MIELQVAKYAQVDDIRQVRRDEEKMKSPKTFPVIPETTKT